jgi:TRAP-type C4-dicarboxylate transport system substrate-binding protein
MKKNGVKKRIVISAAIAASVFTLILFVSPGVTTCFSEEPIVLKTSTFLPRDNKTMYYEYWEKLVSERGKGKIEIKYVGGPETIPIAEHHLAVREGVVDITISPPSYYGKLMPEGIATVASRLNPMEERAGETWNILEERHNEMGLHFLGHGASWQHAYIWSNFKHQNPREDFKGRRFISRGYLNPFMQALGTSPINVSMAETYNALQRKLAAGVIFMELSVFDMKLYEVTKYCVDHPVYRGWLALVINLKKWNSLPEDIRDLLTQASIDADKWGYEKGLELTRENRKIMQKAGMEYLKFSPEDAKWYMDLAQDVVWKEAIERSPVWGPKLREAMIKK